ncbi:MAG: hypothetical protein AABX13_06355 [Nanoarchaeota archaeon]
MTYTRNQTGLEDFVGIIHSLFNPKAIADKRVNQIVVDSSLAATPLFYLLLK